MQKKVLEIVEFYDDFNENIPALRLKSISNKTDYSIVDIHYQKKVYSWQFIVKIQ